MSKRPRNNLLNYFTPTPSHDCKKQKQSDDQNVKEIPLQTSSADLMSNKTETKESEITNNLIDPTFYETQDILLSLANEIVNFFIINSTVDNTLVGMKLYPT